jgi:hypothetical protein
MNYDVRQAVRAGEVAVFDREANEIDSGLTREWQDAGARARAAASIAIFPRLAARRQMNKTLIETAPQRERLAKIKEQRRRVQIRRIGDAVLHYTGEGMKLAGVGTYWLLDNTAGAVVEELDEKYGLDEQVCASLGRLKEKGSLPVVLGAGAAGRVWDWMAYRENELM